MVKKVIVTGINGFVGRHLARELSSHNISIVGVSYEKQPPSSLLSLVDSYFSVNLVDEWPQMDGVDSVIHLAGFAAVNPSFDNPQQYINGNSAMVTNLCEYYLKQEKRPRIVIISSGAVYSSNQSMPIGESGELNYSSPYVVSKILTENQCEYYRNRGLDCVVIRPFNHIGPGQAEGFILPDLYKQLSETKSGSISVGNLETRRDYTDVRDIVRAYKEIALAPTLQHTLYNICSGKSLSGEEILDLLKSSMGKREISVEVDPTKVRPTDIQEIVGDSTRLRDELGWEPEYKITQTVKDFVESRDKV